MPSAGTQDIEDATRAQGEVARSGIEPSALDSLDLGIAEDCEVEMSVDKAMMIEIAEIGVQRCFRRQEVDASDEEVRAIAAMQVELGAAHVFEIYSPKRFTAMASRLGLRPGFAIDLAEEKPRGPQKGQKWDLSKEADIKELEDLVSYEEPVLLTGSPPCDQFSQLLRISANRCNQAERDRRREMGRHHLRTAIKFYRKQYDEGRLFLHEHPAGAESWDEKEMVELQRLPGVFTVTGPMCRFEMQVNHPVQGPGFVRKQTKWVTNSVPRLVNLHPSLQNQDLSKRVL